MKYRAVYIKTYFDNLVLPYQVPDHIIEIEKDDFYVINTKFGEDIGKTFSEIKEFSSEELYHYSRKNYNNHHDSHDQDLDDIEIDDASILEEKEEHVPVDLESLKVVKKANKRDVEEWKKFREEEKEAFYKARKEIEDLNLEMKLINVHFLYQRRKIIFNFNADNRIDFRQLVKRLASIFRTRIEMRQIGVRDAAKIEGGYGVCGLKLCCQRSNCHINSIYLKMAKEQGFIINSSKLTGLCGRLMCCLAYERDFYNEERKKYPDPGTLIKDGENHYKVSSVNMIKGEICAYDEKHHHQKIFQLEQVKKIKPRRNQNVFYKVIQT